MLWAGEPIDAYVGERRIALWRSSTAVGVWEVVDGPKALGEHLRSGVHKERWALRPAVRVWLSGALARPFLMSAVTGLKSWAEARAVAAKRFTQEGGQGGESSIWLEELPLHGDVLGVAVAKSTLDALQQSVAGASMRATSVRPWWAFALDGVRDRLAEVEVVAIADTDSLVILASEAEQWREVVVHEPRPSGPQAEAAIRRQVVSAHACHPRVERARLVLPASGVAELKLHAEFVGSFEEE